MAVWHARPGSDMDGILPGQLARGLASVLPNLLKLPKRPDGGPTIEIPEARGGVMGHWVPSEAKLAPSLRLLRWMLERASELRRPSDLGRADNAEKRLALLDGDDRVLREALDLLARGHTPAKGWYVLEGRTQPDVYLTSPGVLVVIEGKRTEEGATTSTKFLGVRHQMLRHLDGAWDGREGREVVWFFAVEGDDGPEAEAVPAKWQHKAARTVAPDTLAASLPHLGDEERREIAQRFLGVVTWQRICREFGIPWEELPDVVE